MEKIGKFFKMYDVQNKNEWKCNGMPEEVGEEDEESITEDIWERLHCARLLTRYTAMNIAFNMIQYRLSGL
jgi:hypothetical protein